ncbi:MAG: helix-turn-helix transcriptional regulator [Gemmatimonadetes bacterium]|jgi:DNA-binding transcriptional ArsR family regulator|nr:helix-turn-helix transcriptional regulator [Gemmatimonadota bacterium]MBT4611806.1 helix-turn-helix transcriptional regulator [Gemmatimonadota bacterium]MBT5055433.1 helix-turn-helix transcriptional regulator [Gemmatimonadota bacterium]MBT5143447.1 helix-turn-helix transcriptional regulator [Gemmatimonadota bacterium]MBT5589355.1 helix-turn-helix transcriptional regulator [Gemmatimonadota bacterium]
MVNNQTLVNPQTKRLNALFSALADPTRRAMLRRLSRSGMSVGELSSPFQMSKPAVTKHLKVLERAGLLSRDKQGRVHHCTLQPAPLAQAAGWLSYYQNFWESKLGDLDTFLQQEQEGETSG